MSYTLSTKLQPAIFKLLDQEINRAKEKSSEATTSAEHIFWTRMEMKLKDELQDFLTSNNLPQDYLWDTTIEFKKGFLEGTLEGIKNYKLAGGQ